jgi:hypothetical protein
LAVGLRLAAVLRLGVDFFFAVRDTDFAFRPAECAFVFVGAVLFAFIFSAPAPLSGSGPFSQKSGGR